MVAVLPCTVPFTRSSIATKQLYPQQNVHKEVQCRNKSTNRIAVFNFTYFVSFSPHCLHTIVLQLVNNNDNYIFRQSYLTYFILLNRTRSYTFRVSRELALKWIDFLAASVSQIFITSPGACYVSNSTGSLRSRIYFLQHTFSLSLPGYMRKTVLHSGTGRRLQ